MDTLMKFIVSDNQDDPPGRKVLLL